MKTLFKILLMFLVSASYMVFAQEPIKSDSVSDSNLSIVMDANIAGTLTDLEGKCERIAAKPNSTGNDAVYNPPKKVYAPNRPLTNAEICARNPRIQGVKIQLAVVKSNEEANEIKAYFRRRFPTIKVETDASLRPNYKILAGSYFNKQSASGDLSRIKQYFSSAIVIPYMIFCEEANR